MATAKTQISIIDKYYNLSNDLIIKSLIEHGLNIHPTIVKNPYFRYKLFKLFPPIKRCCVQGINLCKDTIIIQSNLEIFEITINSENGLSMIRYLNDNSVSNIFAKSVEIFELFPKDDNLLFIEHSKSIISNAAFPDSDVNEQLRIDYISSDGVVEQSDCIDLKTSVPDSSIIYDLKMDSLTSQEYVNYFKKIQEHEDSTLKSIKRDIDDFTRVNEIIYKSDGYSESIKYFNNSDVLNLIDINSCTYRKRKLSIEMLCSRISDIYAEDEIVARLLQALAFRIGYKLSLRIDSIYNIDEIKLIDKLLDNPKKLMYS